MPDIKSTQVHKYFITIAGNIGVGKSTLTELLARELGWEYVFEPFEENPFLQDFYRNMPRWGFHSQIFFLSKRLQQHYELQQRSTSIVQDRSIYEDAEIFAQNLYIQKTMSEREWQTYRGFYKTLSSLLTPPDLVVYLRAKIPTLLRRIRKRGREYEADIPENYLENLNSLYDEWISGFSICPVLTIETDNVNYLEHNQDLFQVVQKIQNRLYGKDKLTL
jgi:deoxyadenosine/deoxycytidine kinase